MSTTPLSKRELTSLSVNDTRSIRILELVSDFRRLQHFIIQTQNQLSAESISLPGYRLLRACIAEARAILTAPYLTEEGCGKYIEVIMGSKRENGSLAGMDVVETKNSSSTVQCLSPR
jgi:hypothetical protein